MPLWSMTPIQQATPASLPCIANTRGAAGPALCELYHHLGQELSETHIAVDQIGCTCMCDMPSLWPGVGHSILSQTWSRKASANAMCNQASGAALRTNAESPRMIRAYGRCSTRRNILLCTWTDKAVKALFWCAVCYTLTTLLESF